MRDYRTLEIEMIDKIKEIMERFNVSRTEIIDVIRDKV